jgi:hypothetical protein
MLKYSSLIIFLFFLITSCSESTTKTKARKLTLIERRSINSRQGFDPKTDGFRCDSLNVKTTLTGNQISQIIVLLGNNILDTILLTSEKIPGGAEKDIIVTDYNFDGFCEFVIPDKKSASAGGMNYNYFLFDTLHKNFVEINSLPKFIGNFKLDIKNQRVKIYCPNDACFAYYKYENNVFKLVQGEFKANP